MKIVWCCGFCNENCHAFSSGGVSNQLSYYIKSCHITAQKYSVKSEHPAMYITFAQYCILLDCLL